MRWYLAVLVTGAVFSCASATSVAGDERPRKPHLDLRASPRLAFSPVEILVIGELKGGQPTEELHCPALVWDWGDGSRSAHEADCSPFEEGAEVDRLFTARHAFRVPGSYNVQLFLVRGDRLLMAARVPVMVYGQGHSPADSGY